MADIVSERSASASELDAKSLRKILSRFNRDAFSEFAFELCACYRRKFESPGWLPEAGDGVFYAAFIDSYGGSIHQVWVLHFPPTELFSNLNRFCCDDPSLLDRLRSVRKLYKGKTGAWGMVSPWTEDDDQLRGVAIVTNISGYDREAYAECFLPKYKRVFRRSGLRSQFQVGSYDSFVDLSESKTRELFIGFLTRHTDGLSISLENGGASVAPFSCESPITAGLREGSGTPCETVYVSLRVSEQLEEFGSLLKSGVAEAEIEAFLKIHFQEIFGFEYDRIETQLWLRSPELDVGRKDRRLDLFLRNSVYNDWDLVELKRVVRVTTSHRDIPILATELTRAVQQTAYYGKLLGKDSVKEHLKRQGIEYFEPQLKLVIGRKPQIDYAQWRWLTRTFGGDVEMLTYDNLRDSMRAHLIERSRAIK